MNLRRHALFLTALALGIAVRVVVMVGYRPALVSPDSFSYLTHAAHFAFNERRPVGYSLFLRPFVLLLPDAQATVAAVQHVIGLGLAVAGYAFLLRRGLPRWGATLAVLPLLLDPLQLVLEHYVLTDVPFEALLVGACLVLLWRPRPALWQVVAAGAMVGVAGTFRGAGELLLAVFLVAAVFLRLSWTKVGALLVAGLVPLAVYAVGFHSQYGEYAIASDGPRFLYARVAPIVRCHDPQLALPRYEKMLCPGHPVGDRPSTRYYMWGGKQAAQYHVVPPPGKTQLQVVKDFDKRVVRAQPVVYARAVVKDLAGGFMPSRRYEVPGYHASYWLFADHFWSLDDFIHRGTVKPSALKHTAYDPVAGGFMTRYGRWVYTPGPLMALLALAAAGAVLGLGRARRSGDRVAVGLLAGSCMVTLLTGAALSGFSWRYQLPQIGLLPLAGALGLAAMVRGRAAGRPDPEPPLRPLDRAAGRVARLPMPARSRAVVGRAVDTGLLQVALAVLAAVVAAAVVWVGAVGSGWFLPRTAAVFAVAAGGLLGVTLLVARRRSRADVPPGPGGPEGPHEPDTSAPSVAVGR